MAAGGEEDVGKTAREGYTLRSGAARAPPGRRSCAAGAPARAHLARRSRTARAPPRRPLAGRSGAVGASTSHCWAAARAPLGPRSWHARLGAGGATRAPLAPRLESRSGAARAPFGTNRGALRSGVMTAEGVYRHTCAATLDLVEGRVAPKRHVLRPLGGDLVMLQRRACSLASCLPQPPTQETQWNDSSVNSSCTGPQRCQLPCGSMALAVCLRGGRRHMWFLSRRSNFAAHPWTDQGVGALGLPSQHFSAP